MELKASAEGMGEHAPLESPSQVVGKVMRALRRMDEPYPLHGAVMATRYCSPRNRASELGPQIFARYLKDPWYSILADWNEIQGLEEDEECSKGAKENVATCEVLVKCRPLLTFHMA